MRRNIDFEEEYWDTLKVIAHDMGYHSRQSLVQAVIKSFVDQFPMAKLRAIDENAVRKAKRELKEEWQETVKMAPVDQEVLKELAKDVFPEMFEAESPHKDISGLTDGVKEQIEVEAPELPDL